MKQFSIAGYGGFEDFDQYLPAMATGHIDYMLEAHKDFGAKVTIPFASFVLFSAEDNRYINDYANTPQQVYDRFEESGLSVAVLSLGDVYDTESTTDWDSAPALVGYKEAKQTLSSFEFDTPEIIPLDQIKEAFDSIRADLCDRYPALILNRLKPVTVRIPDLDKTVRFSISDGRFLEVPESEQADLIVNSQPFFFALSVPFGVQTLGVSARFRICQQGDANNWSRHRLLFGLNNAEFYLRPKYLFTPANLKYIWARRRGFLSQVATRFALMSQGR